MISCDSFQLEVTGRVLPPPRLSYFHSKGTVLPQDGVWRNRKFEQPAKFSRWALAIHNARVTDIDAVISSLVAQAESLGMQPGPPLFVKSFPE